MIFLNVQQNGHAETASRMGLLFARNSALKLLGRVRKEVSLNAIENVNQYNENQ